MQRLTNCKYCGHQYEYTTYNDELGEVERHELCQNCGHTVDMTYGQGTDNTEWYDDALKYRELFQHITLDRLAALVDADAEGRAVVLPCKVGDTVYVLPNYSAYWDDIEETKITGVSQFPTKSGVSNQIVTSICLCYEWERDFGVRLFLTRAEAEAAMKGASNEE